MALVFNDAFDRTDGGLGSNYVDVVATLTIVSNRVRADASGSAKAVKLVAACGADTKTQVTIPTYSNTSSVVGLWHRVDGSNNGYIMYLFNGLAIIDRYAGGVFAANIDSQSYTVSPGDVMRAEAQGTSLRLYVNDVLRASGTDGTNTGNFAPWVQLTAAGAADTVEIDSFSVESFGDNIAPGKAAPGVTTTGTTCVTSAVDTSASGSSFFYGMVWDNTATFVSIVDNYGNTLTQVGSEIEDTTAAFRARLYRVDSGVGGAAHTATLTVSSSAAATLLFAEIVGGQTSGLVDQSDSRADTASPFTLAAGLTTTQARELLLSFMAADSAGNPATHAETGLGSSMVLVENLDGTSKWPAAMAYSLKSSTGTYNPSWTQSGGARASLWLVTLRALEVFTGPFLSPASSRKPRRVRRPVSTGARLAADVREWW